MNIPILNTTVHGKRLVYLDNAATTQKPQEVIDAISNYYSSLNANVHRGIHTLSEEATKRYEESRITVAQFIKAQPGQIVFTSGTTQSINLVAFGLQLREGDEVVLSEMEHHSNIVPWLELKKRIGITLKYIPLENFELVNWKDIITSNTKVVSITHMSNVLGTINPLKEIIAHAKQCGAITLIDGAQGIVHEDVSVLDLDCDFYAFSAHKLFGPTGLGVLYGKDLSMLEPLNYGGGMIEKVQKNNYSLGHIPARFEAGTPPIAQAIAFTQAIEWFKKHKKVQQDLFNYAREKLLGIPKLTLYQKSANPIFSFTIKGVDCSDLAQYLDTQGVAIRSGHHCAQPLMDVLGIPGCARASFTLYNTKEDVDALIAAINKAVEALT